MKFLDALSRILSKLGFESTKQFHTPMPREEIFVILLTEKNIVHMAMVVIVILWKECNYEQL